MNSEGSLRTHQHNCGPKIEVFGWLDCEIIDALGYLWILGLEKDWKVKEISFKAITKGGPVLFPLEEMESWKI